MGRKSAKIANRKGAADKLKSQVYTKALADVTIAAKSGGGDPETNFLLRIAIERSRKFNVPKDNIERAIIKGTGGDGQGYEDVTYEGYGPHGVAIFVEGSTNNVTRTVANVKNYFNKNGGSLGTNGSLEFIFDRKAVFNVAQNELDEEEFTLEMIDAGAEDVELEENQFEIIGPMDVFGSIQTKLQEMNITPDEARLERIPTSYKEVNEEACADIEKLIDLLENDEDILNVYHNMDLKD